MNRVAYIDLEVEPKSRKILDIGSIRNNDFIFHSASIEDFIHFLKGSEFVCGHNIINHDLHYLKDSLIKAGIRPDGVIDTLFLSPLLFPTKPYHALLKDDKLQSDDVNNPLNDSRKARDLFFDEINAFNRLDDLLKKIFYCLLGNKYEFSGFFKYMNYSVAPETDVVALIQQKFSDNICRESKLSLLIREKPIELAYSLSLINTADRYSITPPWVSKSYPGVDNVFYLLRRKPCLTGCPYCMEALDIHKGLKRFFGFNSYRKFGGEALQEKAVQAAINDQSLLAVFPTGGGKSITFQVPALMEGEAVKGLTIVISPLQSLMKDQVDNLEKYNITDAVTINGLLDPIERSKSFERVENGSASLLYIAPESLRSKSIERLMLGRNIVRFVIDEAHCFSAWGQDFRVDYLYIADFIKNIQKVKNLEIPIPVSCFTATAKLKVIEDIRNYFYDKLGLELNLFTSNSARTNLRYNVFQKNEEEEKYLALRDLVQEKNCPAIVYVARTRNAFNLAERLTQDGFSARPYHGKMDKHEKSANQDAFIHGEIQIMVATSAFGMGVDKKDVGLVVHYEISDSLENYIQEAGRAGRDEEMMADCFILFNEEDLSKHFILLNQTKLSIKEIQQVWKAIKDITRFRSHVSNSALEIARKAGWDENVREIETRVTTAIAALEDAGYIKRGQNVPRIFANSILVNNAQDAINAINASHRFDEKQKINAIRIVKKLFSSKTKMQNADEVAESRVDYISDHLGIVTSDVIRIISLLREENILADTKDLTAFIKKGEQKNRSLNILEVYNQIESFLLTLLQAEESTWHLKELNERLEHDGVSNVTVGKIRTIFNFLSIKNWISFKSLPNSKNHIKIQAKQSLDLIKTKIEKRHLLAKFVVDFLYTKSKENISVNENVKEEVLVGFSVHEIKEAYEYSQLFLEKINILDVEDTLFYLSRIDAIKIEGGFLVIYNRLTIERTEQDNKKRYTKEDYQKLNIFYESKIQQIHIVGEYANRMISDYKDALQFVEDYFQLNYSSFLDKYFQGPRQDEIRRNLNPAKFRQLFGELSPTQLKIINDKESKYIAVAAGPGSGKTRVLVHKLASLMLMEDVKHEQMLMLTFSRAAATEFKKRLLKLIGNAANFIEIKTFHSYCFDLLGRVGNIEKSDNIIKTTIEKIKAHEVEYSRITKTVLVIDEAQDMNADELGLISALMDHNEEMRIIAVGDDDQNIFEFRGANINNLSNFISKNKAVKYELVENYRSKRNLVLFTNKLSGLIKQRLKSTPIFPNKQENGRIKIFRYENQPLISPLVQEILATEFSGTTCVLTVSNEDAQQVAGLLLNNNKKVKLIQSNDEFNLYNLLEVRAFIESLNLKDDQYTISDEDWNNGKKILFNHYGRSEQYSICSNLIRDFELTNPKNKYKSDFLTFVMESKLEDFYDQKGETIIVSTIHKAKGREFDNVILLLGEYQLYSDGDVRLLYVGMTRAKNNLTIHLNSSYLDTFTVEESELRFVSETFDEPLEMSLHLSYRDVWLGYFSHRQRFINQLKTGDRLLVEEGTCLTLSRQPLIKFSKSFNTKIASLEKSGYELDSASINFIVYWDHEESKKEIKIILPRVNFIKTGELPMEETQ